MIPSLSIGPRTLLKHCNNSATAIFWRSAVHSLSLKTSAFQLLQKSSKAASTTPQRPIWDSFAIVRVREFWEDGFRTLFQCGNVGKTAVSDENGCIRGTVDSDMGSFATPTSSCRSDARSPDVSSRKAVTHTPLPSCPNSLACMALPWRLRLCDRRVPRLVRTSLQSCDAYRPFRPRRPPAAAPATARGSAPRRRSGARLSAVRSSPPRRDRCWRASHSISKTNCGAACKPQQDENNNVIKEKKKRPAGKKNLCGTARRCH